MPRMPRMSGGRTTAKDPVKTFKRVVSIVFGEHKRKFAFIVFCIIVSAFSIVYSSAFLGAFAAAIAEAEADTAASSIGMLSARPPVSIVTFTPVPPGLSGGVTALGIVSSLAFSSLIAVLYMGTFGCVIPELLTIAAAGFLGSLFDSFLGATVQVHYRKEDGTLTEKSLDSGKALERARGIPFLDNDIVNLLSGLFSAALFMSIRMILQ